MQASTSTKIVLNILVVSGCWGSVILNHDTKDGYDTCTRATPCLRKCCPEYHVLQRQKCIFAPEYEFKVEAYDGTEIFNKTDVSFSVVHSKECAEHEINVLLKVEGDQMYYLQPDGSLFKSNVEEFITFQHFCLENLVFDKSWVELWAYVCYENERLQSRNHDMIRNCSKYFDCGFLC